jgi:methanogenic corrinoid protein MtbC1
MANITVQNEFLNALILGNRLKSYEFIDNLLKENTLIEDIYEKSIKKSLYQLGELWECGKISVATEHLASAIVEADLNDLYLRRVSTKRINKTVIVSCVENEFHQIGAKMVCDIFEINGWNTYFLGSNVPIIDLIDFIKNTHPDLVAISLSVYHNLKILENLLESIVIDYPKLNILVGGQAFLHGGREVLQKYTNLIYVPDLYSLNSYLK